MPRSAPVRHVRQMPKIYGDLQPPSRPWLRTILRVIRYSMLTAGLVALVYVGYISPVFHIKKVEVVGAVITPESTVLQAVPVGKSIWSFSSASLQASLHDQPTIENIQVLKGLPSTIRVVLTERAPAMQWESNGTVCLIDASGVAFMCYAKATPPDPGSALGQRLSQVPYLIDTKQVAVQVGSQTTSSLLVGFLDATRSQLATNLPELQIDHFELGESTHDITMVTKGGMHVLLSSFDDPGIQIRNLFRLVHVENIPLNATVNLLVPRWAYVS